MSSSQRAECIGEVAQRTHEETGLMYVGEHTSVKSGRCHEVAV
jgi:hypothetical protein